MGPVHIVEGLADGSGWLASRHDIKEVTVGRVRKTKAYSDSIKNSKFETTKVFEQENISVTRPTLENISVTQPTLENISVTRPTENIPLTQPTEFSHSRNQRNLRHSHDQQNLSYPHNQKNFQIIKKGMYQMIQTQTHHRQACNHIKRNAIRRKSFVKTGNITRQPIIKQQF